MPRRGLQSKSKDLALPVMLALTLGPPPTLGDDPPDVPGIADESDLERAYELHHERLLEQSPPCTRPWAYWRYERDVPDDLREHLPTLREVKGGEAASSGNVADAIRLERELARLVWLALEDRLDDDERRALPRLRRDLERRLAEAVAA
jgi:hypothetical protein